MFKVQEDAVGRFHISIGVGKTYSTKSVEELKTAVGHYFGNDCKLGNNPECPLCRAINKEMSTTLNR
jgi:hypothetical protein